MGPMGQAKYFSKVLAGHPAYSISNGDIFFKGSSILDLDPEERSHLGIFLAFNIRSRFQELVMKIFYVSLIILSKIL
jgi:Fe-S cluster assembly ATPase SufC